MKQEREKENIANFRGKWGIKGIPHKGWYCIDIEDTGELSTTCEMCESQSIRYIHYMNHPNYPDTLAVGCICAGHMEEDLNSARERDDFMKSRSAKKARWLKRKWKQSKNGNDFLNVDGFHVVVYRMNKSWGGTVTSKRNPENQIKSRKTYNTIEEVKLASFDLITRLLLEEKTND